MPISALGAAALSGGVNFVTNLGGSVSGGLFSANQAKKNRAFQERMYKRQVEDTINFWNMQNEYNLPSAVYQRELQGMKDNGLNPLLMYNQGGSMSGNLASQPQLPSAPHGAQGSVGSFNTQMDLANLALVEAQARKLNTEADKDVAETKGVEQQTKGIEFTNWLNDQTRNVQVAIRFRDYDRVNYIIDETREKIFNMSQYRLMDWNQLYFQQNMAIKRFNLDFDVQGQYVAQGWEAVKTGRIQANAALRSASAAWLQAKANWNLSNAQIGVLREQVVNYSLNNEFLRKSMGDRLFQQSMLGKQEYWNAQNKMMENIFIESNIDKNKADIYMNWYRQELMQSQQTYLDVQSFMAPLNVVGGFGSNSVGGKMLMPNEPVQRIGFR